MTPFTPQKFILLQGQVWCRGTDGNFYLYGGASNNVYDTTQATVQFPFFDMKAPATKKLATAIDADITGTWTISGTGDWITGTLQTIATNATQATFDQGFVPFSAQGTHFSLQFTTTYVGSAVLSSAIMHYTTAEQPTGE